MKTTPFFTPLRPLGSVLVLVSILGMSFGFASPPSSERAAQAEAGSKADSASSSLPSYVEALLRRHEKATFFEAHFEEKKEIAFLNAPLTSTGRVYFSRPQRFARVTESPKKSKLLIDADKIQIQDEGGKKTELDLKERPELRALIEGILFLFSGDRKALLERFSVASSGDEKSWTVELTPKKKELLKLMKKLSFSGSGSMLTSYRVDEASGDFSITTLTQMRFDRKLTPAEQKKIFSLAPKN